MSRIDKAGPDRHDEIVTTFRKEEDKTYTKITKKLSRDWKTGGISQMKRQYPVIEEGPYEITADSKNYDEKVSYQDFDGSTKWMYFKLVTKEDEV